VEFVFIIKISWIAILNLQKNLQHFILNFVVPDMNVHIFQGAI
jgi:hypothetical protein